MARKVIIIGIDGGELSLIKSLAEKGELQNFRKIMDEGAYGTLESTTPTITPVAWTSMLTGLKPAKHGILNFFKRKEGGYESTAMNSTDIKVETLWSLATNSGKKLIALDVPMTYPPAKVNGIMISGMTVPSLDSEFTYPSEFKAELLSLQPGYPLDVSAPKLTSKDSLLLSFTSDCKRVLDSRINLSRHLLSNYPWDLFFMVFTTTDRLQHIFWKFIDETHPNYAGDQKGYGKAILEAYRSIDDFLGEIISSMDERTLLLIPSDHGFGQLHDKNISIERWLEDNGFYTLNRRELIENSDFSSIGKDGFPNSFEPLAKGDSLNLSFSVFNKRLSFRVPFKSLLFLGSKGAYSLGRTPKGMAVTVSAGNFYAGVRTKINGLVPGEVYRLSVEALSDTPDIVLELCQSGESSNGINTASSRTPIGSSYLSAEPSVYSFSFKASAESIEIGALVTTYGGNATGTATIKKISLKSVDWSKTTAYTADIANSIFINVRGRNKHGLIEEGKEYERLRDELIEKINNIKDERTKKPIVEIKKAEEQYGAPLPDSAPDLAYFKKGLRNDSVNKYIVKATHGWSGTHRLKGIVFAYGKDVKKQEIEANICDVVPTVLYYMGIPIPESLDGSAMDVFDSEFKKHNGPKFSSASSKTTSPKNYSEDENKLVTKRLSDLGYLD